MVSRSARTPGFVLAAVLWLLAGIAVVAALLTAWSLDQVRQAQAASARVQARQSMISTRDSLLYLLATTPRTLAGLPTRRLAADQVAARRLDEFGALDRSPQGSELRTDGSVYLGWQGLRFSLQDESGLLSWYWPSNAVVDGLLARYGAAPEQVPALRDTFLDYIDTDSLRRLHGAEVDEYERLKRPPPPNRRLLHSAELATLPGWEGLDAESLAELIEDSTTYTSGGVNPNTAPASLLARLLPGCPSTCEALLAARAQQPFSSGPELQARLGIRLPGDEVLDYRFGPSDSLRLTLWAAEGAAWRIHVRLTPLADRSAPWLISAAYALPRPARNDPPKPTGSSVLGDPAPGRR